MAEAIGIVSALATLVSSAVASSTALYQTIQSFKKKENVVRDLRDEVEDLGGVLRVLQEVVGDGSIDIGLQILEKPLARCSKHCKEYNDLITKCTERSTQYRTSVRDWVKLRYMGEDIVGFKNTLGGYKSTINIALAGANLRTSKITNDVLDEYKELIEDTKCDLESHLQDIKNKLLRSNVQSEAITEVETTEFKRMHDEKESIQQCLEICAQVSDYVEGVRRNSLRDTSSPSDAFSPVSSLTSPGMPWLITAEAFNSAQNGFMSSRRRLLQCLHGVDKELQIAQYGLPPPQERQRNEQRELQEEVESTEESLAICHEASTQANEVRMNIYENISVGDDSQQLIVTLKDLISAKRIKAGSRALQILGQITPSSLEHVCRRHNGSVGEEDNECATTR